MILTMQPRSKQSLAEQIVIDLAKCKGRSQVLRKRNSKCKPTFWVISKGNQRQHTHLETKPPCGQGSKSRTPVNIPIPTKIDKNGWCTYPKLVPLVLIHSHVSADCGPSSPCSFPRDCGQMRSHQPQRTAAPGLEYQRSCIPVAAREWSHEGGLVFVGVCTPVLCFGHIKRKTTICWASPKKMTHPRLKKAIDVCRELHREAVNESANVLISIAFHVNDCFQAYQTGPVCLLRTSDGLWIVTHTNAQVNHRF